MAIIATLKQAETGYPASAHSIASIPLNKLVPWDGNVRKTGASDGLEELIANIAAHGVLQSLVVRKTHRGKFAIVAGRRRYLALSALSDQGAIASDAPVPCRVIPGTADAAEISLAENVVRAPMHPADQLIAFRALIDGGSTPTDIAARFGVSEAVVNKRLRLARVSTVVFDAYRNGDLTLEQVQAFAISDDHAAQERLFDELTQWSDDPDTIRRALTQGEIAATDKRVRFITVAAYEAAGGAVRRDLFAEDEDGVFILDTALLDRLASEKLKAAADAARAEGWNWVEAHPEFGYEARARFGRMRPEPLPMSEEAAAEQRLLTDEYNRLFDVAQEGDEEASERMDAIEQRISELEETESVYTPETKAIAGVAVTIGTDGEVEMVRGLIRPEDMPDQAQDREHAGAKEKSAFSVALVESLTAQKSAAIGAQLAMRPDIALAAVAHALASPIFALRSNATSLQLESKVTHHREISIGKNALEEARAQWTERLPGESDRLWKWCLDQDREALLELLAFCAASAVDAVQRKHDRTDCARLAHADKLVSAVGLNMASWFTPTADNFFSRVGRDQILAAIAEAKGAPAKRSWEKLKKSELAALAEREVAGTGWLPQPLRA